MLIGKTGGARPAKGATGGGGGRSGLARRVLAAGDPAGRPRPGYGPLVLGGLALCAAVAVALVLVRRERRGDPTPEDAAPPAPPSASGPAPAQTPEPPEGPSSGPSPGEDPGPRGDAPEPSPGRGIEERVRARIGEDPRTRGLPPVSIWVDDGMAWIEGGVPSPEAREALTEVAGGVEGVNIVVNRAVVVRDP